MLLLGAPDTKDNIKWIIITPVNTSDSGQRFVRKAAFIVSWYYIS